MFKISVFLKYYRTLTKKNLVHKLICTILVNNRGNTIVGASVYIGVIYIGTVWDRAFALGHYLQP